MPYHDNLATAYIVSLWKLEIHFENVVLEKVITLKYSREQSFTSLKAVSGQDINWGLHLAGALMEHFLVGSAPLSPFCICYSSHFGWCTNVLS